MGGGVVEVKGVLVEGGVKEVGGGVDANSWSGVGPRRRGTSCKKKKRKKEVRRGEKTR